MSRFSTLFFLLSVLGVNSQLPDLAPPHTCEGEKSRYQAGSCCGSSSDTPVSLSKSLNCDIGMITAKGTLLDPLVANATSLVTLGAIYDSLIANASDSTTALTLGLSKAILLALIPEVGQTDATATGIMYKILAMYFLGQNASTAALLGDATAVAAAAEGIPSYSLANNNIADITISTGRSFKQTFIMPRTADTARGLMETYGLVSLSCFLFSDFEIEVTLSEYGKTFIDTMAAFEPPGLIASIQTALSEVSTLQQSLGIPLGTKSITESVATGSFSSCETADKTYNVSEFATLVEGA